MSAFLIFQCDRPDRDSVKVRVERFKDWASQQRQISDNKQKNSTRKPSTLSPKIDEVDTFLLQLNEKCSPIQNDWENFSEIEKNFYGILNRIFITFNYLCLMR